MYVILGVSIFSKLIWLCMSQLDCTIDPPCLKHWELILMSFWQLSERRFFFALHFILNENILFWLIISYQKPFVFSVPVFSNIYLKIKFNTKIVLTYAISIVKWFFFLDFCLRKNFFFSHWIWFFTDVSQQYCENFRKIDQAELVKTLPPSYLTHRFLHNLYLFSLWDKVKIFYFLETNVLNKTFCA